MFMRCTGGSGAAAAVAASLTHSVYTSYCQKRFDHDRWYGHTLELDNNNYRFTGEPPSWMKPVIKTDEETEFAKSVLPHVDFASSYECLLFDADRLNSHLNRKEFGNELKYRLEKQSNCVARAEALIKNKMPQNASHNATGDEGVNPQKLEDIMIARIFDEEHVQAEMKYVKCIRANELAEDNRLDILPGGSPNSLREKTRWNVNTELHPIDRAEIGTRLTAWLPEKYHIVYFDDFQTVAANDENARREMMTIVDNVSKEYAAEAKSNGYEKDLEETVAELYEDVDFTRDITPQAIKSCNDIQILEEWAHKVHEYNGDDRILDIYERAAELTKNEEHAGLVKQMREWRKAKNKIEKE